MSSVRLLTGANVLGVWSKFMIIECGIAYFSTRFATWYCKSSFASRLQVFFILRNILLRKIRLKMHKKIK